MKSAIRRPLRGRHSPVFSMNCITWKVNSNSGLQSFLGHHSQSLVHRFSRGQRFPQSPFCLNNKVDCAIEGTENDPKKASKVTIFDFTLEWHIHINLTLQKQRKVRCLKRNLNSYLRVCRPPLSTN